VRVLETVEHLADDRGRSVARERCARPDQLGERSTGRELHHHERVGAHLTDIEHADHVRVLELRRDLRLPSEPHRDLGIAAQSLVQHLDREAAADFHVPRAKDVAHCPTTEELLDAVLRIEDLANPGSRFHPHPERECVTAARSGRVNCELASGKIYK
jgi:hypothetical protein